MSCIRHQHIILYMLLAMSGCAENPQSIPTTNTTQQPPADPVVATVNNQPIHQSELLQTLYAGPGRKVLDELIQFHLIRQYAQQKGVTLTDDMIRHQLQQILDDMAPGKTPAQQAVLLNYLLESRGLTHSQFNLIVKQQALLNELIDKNIDITDAMLKDEYEYLHGPQVQIRLVVAASSRKIENAQRRLNAGENFIDLVRELSEDQQSLGRDGLIGPFSRTDHNIPQAIRDAAFAIQTPGEFSSIIQYNDNATLEHYGWFRLEQIIPADGVPFEQVRGELEKSLRQKIIRQRMNTLGQQLKTEATIQILEPRLLPARSPQP